MTPEELLRLVERKTGAKLERYRPSGLSSSESHQWRTKIRCLSPLHVDNNPSAEVTLSGKYAGRWRCYGCGQQGKITEEEVTLDLTPLQLRKVVEPESVDDSPRVSEDLWRLRYMQFKTSDHYWKYQRGFSDEAVEHFLLGMDVGATTPVYPARDNLGIIGPVRRSTASSGKKHYYYPSGFQASSNLFGIGFDTLPRVAGRSLCLMEGATDVMKCWDVLQRTGRVSPICTAGIYGSRLSDAQVNLIMDMEPSKIVLMFDNDKAGWKCTRDAYRMLAPMFPVFCAEYEGEDPFDYFENYYEDAQGPWLVPVRSGPPRS